MKEREHDDSTHKSENGRGKEATTMNKRRILRSALRLFRDDKTRSQP